MVEVDLARLSAISLSRIPEWLGAQILKSMCNVDLDSV